MFTTPLPFAAAADDVSIRRFLLRFRRLFSLPLPLFSLIFIFMLIFIFFSSFCMLMLLSFVDAILIFAYFL